MLRWGGDWRYTPWVLKFFGFNQMPFALGTFVAIVYLAIETMVRSNLIEIHSQADLPIVVRHWNLSIGNSISSGLYDKLLLKRFAIAVDRAGGRQAFPYGQLLIPGVIHLVGLYPVSESGTHRAES